MVLTSQDSDILEGQYLETHLVKGEGLKMVFL